MNVILSEREVWGRALDGDSHAFAILFDMHKDRVFRHASYHLDSRADAEDATAGAFLELWRSRKRVVIVDDSILPWLLVVTTNVARNVGRTQRRYRALLARLPRQDAPIDETEAAIQRIDAQRELAAIAPKLRELSSVDSALITLTALEGYSITSAAAAVGLTAGAARTRLHRLRSLLRAHGVEATEGTS